MSDRKRFIKNIGLAGSLLSIPSAVLRAETLTQTINTGPYDIPACENLYINTSAYFNPLTVDPLPIIRAQKRNYRPDIISCPYATKR